MPARPSQKLRMENITSNPRSRAGVSLISCLCADFVSFRRDLPSRMHRRMGRFPCLLDNPRRVVASRRLLAVVCALLAVSGLVPSSKVHAVSLTWQDNSDNEDGFKIERSTDGVNFTELQTRAQPNQTSHTDNTVAPAAT